MIDTNTLHSFKKQSITEVIWPRPEMTDDEIEIQTIYAGVCRSDVGSYCRWESMPFTDLQNPAGIVGTFGHESLGKVTAIGKNITGVKLGDLVAAWSHPAFAQYFYAKQNEFVVVPEALPKYILQPAACAINIATKTLHWMQMLNMYHDKPISANTYRHQFDDILLLGSGFMSVVIGQFFKYKNINIDVVGNSNKQHWNGIAELKNIDDIIASGKQYSAVIDLTSKGKNFEIITKLTKPEGLICYAATPYDPITTNFFENCWNCHTIIMPSPRNKDFNEMMTLTRDLIQKDIINTEFIWTKGYERWIPSEVKRAFEDGANRTPDYVRGYLKF